MNKEARDSSQEIQAGAATIRGAGATAEKPDVVSRFLAPAIMGCSSIVEKVRFGKITKSS
jgi:hypothetical protein